MNIKIIKIHRKIIYTARVFKEIDKGSVYVNIHSSSGIDY